MSFNTGSRSQYRDISTIPVFLNLMISLQKFSLPTKVDSGVFPLEETCSLFIPVYKTFLALPTLSSGMSTTLLSIQVLQSCHNIAIKASFRVPFMCHFLHERYLLLFLHSLKQLLCTYVLY